MVPYSRVSKEQHVWGLEGTSPAEVICIAAVPTLLILALGEARSRLETSGLWRQRYSRLALEFMVVVVPNVGQLLGATSPALLVALLLGAAAAVRLSRWRSSPGQVQQEPAPDISGFRDALGSYRGALMILTCISILGVDFHAFPRRFAKAETFGTGLMDVGVGGIVAASAVGRGLSGRGGGGSRAKAASRALVLAALGAGRLLFTTSVDYQTHVGEYGVHWTFFLTLAALQVVNLLLPWPRRSGARAVGVGAAVLCCYQWALSRWHLIDWVHAEDRGPDLLSANKEGLASLAGYWALQLLGEALGRLLAGLAAGGAALKCRRQTRSRAALAAQQAVIAAALWSAFWLSATYLQPVSRRACNATYVLWVLAITWHSISLCWLAHGAAGARSALLAAVSDNMLAVFLAANLLTGAVNLAMDTLAASDQTARVVVVLYMSLVCTFAAILPTLKA